MDPRKEQKIDTVGDYKDVEDDDDESDEELSKENLMSITTFVDVLALGGLPLNDCHRTGLSAPMEFDLSNGAAVAKCIDLCPHTDTREGYTDKIACSVCGSLDNVFVCECQTAAFCSDACRQKADARHGPICEAGIRAMERMRETAFKDPSISMSLSRDAKAAVVTSDTKFATELGPRMCFCAVVMSNNRLAQEQCSFDGVVDEGNYLALYAMSVNRSSGIALPHLVCAIPCNPDGIGAHPTVCGVPLGCGGACFMASPLNCAKRPCNEDSPSAVVIPVFKHAPKTAHLSADDGDVGEASGSDEGTPVIAPSSAYMHVYRNGINSHGPVLCKHSWPGLGGHRTVVAVANAATTVRNDAAPSVVWWDAASEKVLSTLTVREVSHIYGIVPSPDRTGIVICGTPLLAKTEDEGKEKDTESDVNSLLVFVEYAGEWGSAGLVSGSVARIKFDGIREFSGAGFLATTDPRFSVVSATARDISGPGDNSVFIYDALCAEKFGHEIKTIGKEAAPAVASMKMYGAGLMLVHDASDPAAICSIACSNNTFISFVPGHNPIVKDTEFPRTVHVLDARFLCSMPGIVVTRVGDVLRFREETQYASEICGEVDDTADGVTGVGVAPVCTSFAASVAELVSLNITGDVYRSIATCVSFTDGAWPIVRMCPSPFPGRVVLAVDSIID